MKQVHELKYLKRVENERGMNKVECESKVINGKRVA